MPFELRGTDDMIRRLRAVGVGLSRDQRNAVEDEVTHVLFRSKNEFVPVDKGRLRDSGRIDMSGSNQFQSQGRIIYDGPYAIPIHELPNYNPPTWTGTNVNFRVGGPKYIEIPLREEANSAASRIGAKLRF